MAWRVWLFDGLTGVLDREINIGSFSWRVTVSDSSFETSKDRNVGKDELNGFSLPWEVFGEVSETERRDLVAPYRRGLCLMWEDNRKRLFPIVAGIISSLTEVLSRRYLVHDSEFGTNAEHTAPGVFEYKGLSLRAIACNVIDVCTNRRKNGRLPLDLPYLREQGTHERTYNDNDIQNLSCADILKKIANVQDGIDMQFRPVYDESSRRQIYCDLKDIQECRYDFASGVLRSADAVLAGNINFSRPLLKLAKEQHKLVATDVHVLSNPDDDYNREFLESADIVFLSDEGISGDYQHFLSAIGARFSCRLIVLGMGSKGAMMYLKDENRFVYRPAYSIGSIVSTVGAGDALFSSFMHYYVNGMKPEDALDRAQLFAAMKIRSASASKGFPTGNELEEMFSRLHS